MRLPRGRRIPLIARSSLNIPDSHAQARLFAFICFALLVIGTSGCAKKAPSKAELRAITGEILASAQKITARKSEITVRPESTPAKPGGTTQITEHIYVSLSEASQEQALEQSLGDIARRHKLTLATNSSGGGILVQLAFGGTVTHEVHIAMSGPAAAVSQSGGAPRLAIIIDDLGRDEGAARSVLALPFPVTASVIPHLPHSTEVADEAFRRGDQVLLHLPMESESETKQEGVELRVGMSARQVESALDGMLETVPHAVGVNNHQGSRATADTALMQELMPALRQRRLFFIDSRTTTATVAYNVAETSGVRAASRKVFLDDAPTKEAVRGQLNLAARDAARDGFAIAIGHPHPATLAALAETVPQLESRGIRLVFASDLVR